MSQEAAVAAPSAAEDPAGLCAKSTMAHSARRWIIIHGRPGHTWHVYRVNYHHDLGPVVAVLAKVGIDRSVLPSSQNRWVKNPEIQKLIDYAVAEVSHL